MQTTERKSDESIRGKRLTCHLDLIRPKSEKSLKSLFVRTVGASYTRQPTPDTRHPTPENRQLIPNNQYPVAITQHPSTDSHHSITSNLYLSHDNHSPRLLCDIDLNDLSDRFGHFFRVHLLHVPAIYAPKIDLHSNSTNPLSPNDEQPTNTVNEIKKILIKS